MAKTKPENAENPATASGVSRRLTYALIGIVVLFVVLLPVNLRLLDRAKRDAREADALSAAKTPASDNHVSPPSIGAVAAVAAKNPTDPAARIALSEALAASGRPLDAVEELKGAIRLAPNNADSHTRLGQLYVDLNYADLAVEELRTSIRLAPADSRPVILLAYSLGKLGRFRDAFAALKTSESANPKSVELKVVASATLGAMSDFSASRTYAEEAIRLAPDDPQALSNLATAYMRDGRVQEAIDLLRKASAKDPSNVAYRVLLAQACAKTPAREPEGSRILEDLLRSRPESKEARISLAGILLRQHQFAAAIPHLEWLAARDRSYKNTLFMLGQAYSRVGRDAEGRRMIAEYRRNEAASAEIANRQIRAAMHPEDSKNRLALAREYIQRENYGAALYELKGVRGAGPISEEIKPLMMRAYLHSGRVVEYEELKQGKKLGDSRITYGGSLDAGTAMVRALAVEQDKVVKSPRDSEAWLRLGTVLGRSGDLASSIGALSRAAALAPANPVAWKTLAHANGLAGHKSEEIQALEKWTEAAPTDSAAWIRLGDALLAVGWVAEAYPVAERAVKSNPASYQAHALLSKVQYYRGAALESIAEMQKARDLGAPPDVVEPQIATVHFVMAHYRDSLAILDRYLKQSPDDVKALALHGSCLEQDTVNGGPLAEQDYRRIIALSPQNPDGYYRLGVLLRKQRKWRESADNLETALKLNPRDPDTMKALSSVFMQVGNVSRAKALISQYEPMEAQRRELQRLQTRMAVQPKDASVRAELGKIYLAQGRHEDAIADLRHALEISPNIPGARTALVQALNCRTANYKASAHYKPSAPSASAGSPESASLTAALSGPAGYRR